MQYYKRNRLSFWLWVLLIASFLLTWVALYSSGIILTPRIWFDSIFLLLVIVIILFAGPYIREDKLFYLGTLPAQYVLSVLFIASFQYVGPGLQLPLVDSSLIAADHFLGFDWMSFARWEDGLDIIFTGILGLAYTSIVIFPLVLMFTLPAYKQYAHAQAFIIAVSLAGVICGVLSSVFPAVGAYVYYNIAPHDFVHLQPMAGRAHEKVFFGLQAHTLHRIAMPNVGIVTFPSYHASMAVLMLYFSLVLKRARWFFVPLNALMLFSTPVEGGHYLMDVVAGIVIAFISIFAAHLLVKKYADAAPVSV